MDACVKSGICTNHAVNVCNVLQSNLCSKWINSAFSELFFLFVNKFDDQIEQLFLQVMQIQFKNKSVKNC
jgi:hypothetical protein